VESSADGAEFGRLDKTRTEDWYWDGGEIQVELNAGAYKERPGQEFPELSTTNRYIDGSSTDHYDGRNENGCPQQRSARLFERPWIQR
jgi:hypothetical protein